MTELFCKPVLVCSIVDGEKADESRTTTTKSGHCAEDVGQRCKAENRNAAVDKSQEPRNKLGGDKTNSLVAFVISFV